MTNDLGEIVYQSRLDQDLTQDEFGSKYEVSGPAIFKFEKGYVRPSLRLWLRISGDAGLSERRAVLLWLRSGLPEGYRQYIDLRQAKGEKKRPKKRGGKVDYSEYDEPAEMRKAAHADKNLPKPLRDFLDDDEVWALYRPTGHEINILRDRFAPLGKGTKSTYGEALRLIREFTHSF